MNDLLLEHSAAPDQTFAVHRGVVPLLSVFATLAVLEMLAMHLLVALEWPRFAWLMTGLTAISIAWLVAWIRSWKRMPYRLSGDTLTLHMGSLRSLRLPLSQISRIDRTVSADRLKARECRNLVPIAFPNRIVELNTPLDDRRRSERVAVRPDDPLAFDRALSAAGIAICD